MKKIRKRGKYFKNRIQLFERHVHDFNFQRSQFNQQIEELSPQTAIIVIDFKENVKINISHDTQISSEFYQHPHRTIFDIVMIYADKTTQKHYFDIGSDCTKHDSFFVIKALKKCFDHSDFKEHNFSSLIFWMDNCQINLEQKNYLHFLVNLSKKFGGIFSLSIMGRILVIQGFHKLHPC